MLVPGTYYSRVATEAEGMLESREYTVTEAVETAFGFIVTPDDEIAMLDMTDAEISVVVGILKHRNT